MKIVGICGFTFYAIERAARLPSRRSQTVCTEDLETEKGYLAFLEIENADEKEVIQKTLRGVADPRLFHPYDKGLVIWCIDSTTEKKDVFRFFVRSWSILLQITTVKAVQGRAILRSGSRSV